MPYTVNFKTVSTVGVESSPVAAALAGLRANEARYFKNKHDHVFTVEPAAKATRAIDWVHRILKEERDIVVASPPLEATSFQVENIRWTYVFYDNGLSINVADPRCSRSQKGWGPPPSSALSSSRDRSRSWPGRSAARTSISRVSTEPIEPRRRWRSGRIRRDPAVPSTRDRESRVAVLRRAVSLARLRLGGCPPVPRRRGS